MNVTDWIPIGVSILVGGVTYGMLVGQVRALQARVQDHAERITTFDKLTRDYVTKADLETLKRDLLRAIGQKHA